MALALTIFIGMVVLVLGLIGYFRDPRRGMLALFGTLGGAALVSFWGTQWGQSLASRFVGGDPQRITFIVSCVVFLWSALLVGYGSGMLLSRPKSLSFQQRLSSALLGILNGVLIVGYLLRYATEQQTSFAATVRSNPVASILHDGLPLLFLGLAVVVTLAVLVRGVANLFGGRAAPAAPPPSAAKPATSPAPAASAASASTERRIDDRGVLDKIKRQS